MLSVEGLTKRYGHVVALENTTFSVHPGRILGFLGPNTDSTSAAEGGLALLRNLSSA